MKIIRQKILIVFGTRPEAIKMAPLIMEFQMNDSNFDTRVCVTGQHREMLDQVLTFFNITADYDLNLMRPNQSLSQLTADIITGLDPIFQSFKPDYTFVHGDTTTSFAASLAAFYAKSKVCHVEAGLRTNNKYSPFPEEINRQLTCRLSDFHFAPTQQSKQNLINENIEESRIITTGNTVIDALFQSVNKVRNKPSDFIQKIVKKIGDKEMILVTGHRRENHGEGFKQICEALVEIANKLPNVYIIYPVHLNPNVQHTVYSLLENISNILLINPLEYPDFIWMMDRSKLIITDSGGVQEEAPSLGKPVLVLRDTTERPEAISAGTVKLVGTNKEIIIKETLRLFSDGVYYSKMSEAHNPYGDGNASHRIFNFISKGL